ncbi:hypothetical protein [Chamaesiphon sp. VAR_48_metabat_403]|uniref:hypothetical protein n=1 Tax=Chamaesiphon sp. VAR_48_metabat_403 TaxID=2964700 RepID=UPI00286E7F89|nr:hypothetical protein [Chamaesiphon sp. VAR_48_metabat_403]
MFTSKFRIAIAVLIALVPIVSNIQLDKANANPTSTESAAEIDRRKTQELFSTPTEEDRRRYRIVSDAIGSWEKTVDAAGLHTLLNKNKQIYTLLKFDFTREMEISTIRKLFTPENQADLQRIVKCHVIPFRLLKTTIPNNSTVVLKTMEDGCTVKVRGEFIEKLVPEEVATTVSNGTSCSYQGSIGGLPVTRCSETSRPVYKKTGKMITYRKTKIWIDGEQVDEAPNGGGGMYIPYQIYKMKMPPDLQLKYGK